MEKPDIEFKPTGDPLTENLPEFLKNPANFEDIQRKILSTILSTCTHSDMLAMASCAKCTERMKERRKLLKELGFKNPRQYMQWRKTHEEIKKRFPLVDWKKKTFITIPSE